MFAKFWGIVDDIEENNLVINVQGVGYLVSCARTTLTQLRPGLAVTLYIETDIREGAIQLFGFLDPAERHWYRLLHSVQGVGGKAALAILSALAIPELARAILSGDKTSLTRADGVGPKIATRILTELKEKAATAPQDVAKQPEISEEIRVVQQAAAISVNKEDAKAGPPSSEAKSKSGAKAKPVRFTEDAVSALENLGYNRSQAYGAVLEAEADLAEDQIDLAVLIRTSLQKLSETL